MFLKKYLEESFAFKRFAQNADTKVQDLTIT